MIDAATAQRRFVALTALRWLPVGIVIPVFVLVMRARGLDLAEIGLLTSMYSATILLLELPTGGLADVVGRRPVLVASALLTLVSVVGFATARSAGALAAAYVVFGAGRALDSGPLQAWYVDAVRWADPVAPVTSGLARAGVAGSLGLGAGSLLGGAAVAVAPLPSAAPGAEPVLIDLSAPFLLAGAVVVLHVLAVLACMSEPRRPTATWRFVAADVPRTVRRAAALTLARPRLRRILAFTLVLGLALAAVELLSPSVVADLLGGESEAASAYAVLVTCGFLGTAAGSAIAPRFSDGLGSAHRAVAVATVVAALALAGIGLPAVGAVAVAYVGFYLALGLANPLVDSLTHAEVESRQRATVLSVCSMALQLGGLLAGLSVGALAGATSAAVALVVVAVVLAAGAGTMVRWPDAGRQASGEASS